MLIQIIVLKVINDERKAFARYEIIDCIAD